MEKAVWAVTEEEEVKREAGGREGREGRVAMTEVKEWRGEVGKNVAHNPHNRGRIRNHCIRKRHRHHRN